MRVGWNNQDNPFFTRMLDRDTYWGRNNGLATLIPTLLHFGLIGYPFVLPGLTHKNSKSYEMLLNLMFEFLFFYRYDWREWIQCNFAK